MLPSVNHNLFLSVNSIDEEEAKIEYKSRIADAGDGYLAIEIPIQEKTGRLKRLYIGDEISAYYVSDGGVKNYFQSSVLGFTEDVIRLVIIKSPDPESITRVQRRNFLRVPAELEMAVRITEQLQFVVMTEDVGGGGISFFCEKVVPVQLNQIASCWLLVNYKNGKIDHIPFKGEVVRVKPLEMDKLLVMMRYSEITDHDRQKIIRYCFERQLDFRKR